MRLLVTLLINLKSYVNKHFLNVGIVFATNRLVVYIDYPENILLLASFKLLYVNKHLNLCPSVDPSVDKLRFGNIASQIRPMSSALKVRALCLLKGDKL